MDTLDLLVWRAASRGDLEAYAHDPHPPPPDARPLLGVTPWQLQWTIHRVAWRRPSRRSLIHDRVELGARVAERMMAESQWAADQGT